MIGWLLKKVSAAPQPAPRIASPRTEPDSACAIWHDISRALDAKPRVDK